MQNPAKKLLWALAFSIAAHLAVLFGPHISLPLSLAPAPVLEARLEKLPPPTPAQRESPRLQRAAKPKPVKKISARPVATAAAPETPAAEPPHMQPPDAPPTVVKSEPAMPQQVAIRYTVFKGVGGMSVGRAEQTWKLDGSHYTISSVAEASGLFSLFASGKHIQVSRGEITPSGLKPSSYRVERGQVADKIDTARFDWSTMTLSLASGDGNQQTLKLPEGAQDLLSFMYQLAYAPPQLSSVKLNVTNGRKLDSYAYWVVEEALETPMGRLKTLHLGKQREENERDTEVWLAADYHYLPVKISQVDKDGDGLVLLANEIAIKQ